MTTITREQAQKIIDAADEVITALAGTNENVHPESDNMLRLWDDLNDRYAPPEVVRELARIALDAQAAAPVYQWRERYVDSDLWDDCTQEQYEGFAKRPDVETRILYTAPPAPVVDADDNFYSWFGREWEQYYQPNNYSLSAKKHLGAIAESAWFACRAAMLEAGNSLVTPDGWVMVPKEITCEMDDAAWDAYHETRSMSDIWAALLAAAPQQEE